MLGVIVLIEAFIIIKFYNRIEKLQSEKQELVEARRLDTKETTKEVTQVMSDYSQNIRVLTEKIVVGKHNDRNAG